MSSTSKLIGTEYSAKSEPLSEIGKASDQQAAFPSLSASTLASLGMLAALVKAGNVLLCHSSHHCRRRRHGRRPSGQHVACCRCLIFCACPLHTRWTVLHAPCSRDLLCTCAVAEMANPGNLPEPTTADHLAKLEPRKRKGGNMSKKDLQDPAKAKYLGPCCKGTRVWGDGNPSVFMDAYAFTARPEQARPLASSSNLPHVVALSPALLSCVLPA